MCKTPKIVNFDNLKTNDFHQIIFLISLLTRCNIGFRKKKFKNRVGAELDLFPINYYSYIM